MADPVATLSTFTRQFDAPHDVNPLRYAADHGNDFSKKISTTCEDVYNAVMDVVGWLFSDEKTSFKAILESGPRTAKKKDHIDTKSTEIGRLDNQVLPVLLNNCDKTSFNVDWQTFSGDKRVVFTQPPKDALVKYVWIDSYLVEGTGDQEKLTKIESKLLFGKTFFDVYQDLQACMNWNGNEYDQY